MATFTMTTMTIIIVILWVLLLGVDATGNNPPPTALSTSSKATTISNTENLHQDEQIQQEGEYHQEKIQPTLDKPRKKRQSIDHATQTTIKSSKSKSSSSSSQSSPTLRRIKKEYKDAVEMGIAYDWLKGRLAKSSKQKNSTQPPPVCIGPLATNLKHWHFSFLGCGIYEQGIYHGRILLPKDYPLSPPRVQMWTPSGRFKPHHDICLSASAYHPETWTPRWTVLSLVQSLRLHMLTNPQEIGGVTSSAEETLEYARKSLDWKHTFKAGKAFITIDHAQMMRQGAIELENEYKGQELSQDSLHSTTAGDFDKVIEALEEGDHPEVAFQEALPRAKTNDDGQRVDGESRPSVATQRQRIRSTRTQTALRSVLLVISKLFASPARIALISFILLVWMLTIP
jgi:ubiquitin-protein ligase